MGSAVTTYDPSDAIRAVVLADPRVQAVELIGSRAAGTATELSDWDFVIVSTDPGGIAAHLPSLVAELKPLAQLGIRWPAHLSTWSFFPER
jgi:predicted nucleotidyltransferase